MRVIADASGERRTCMVERAGEQPRRSLTYYFILYFVHAFLPSLVLLKRARSSQLKLCLSVPLHRVRPRKASVLQFTCQPRARRAMRHGTELGPGGVYFW